MAYLAALSLSSGMHVGFAAVSGIALGLIIYGVIVAFGLALAGSLQSTIGANGSSTDAPSR